MESDLWHHGWKLNDRISMSKRETDRVSGELSFQKGGPDASSVSLQSKLLVCLRLWMCTASRILLLQYLGSCSSTLAPSQSTLWSFPLVWTTVPFLASFFFTASAIRFFRFLDVCMARALITLYRWWATVRAIKESVECKENTVDS